MAGDLGKETLALLHAVQFAARAHRDQFRKDGRTPYASHPFRVCLIVRHVFGIDDPQALTAALLHDTIEDTTTDFDDVEEAFGEAVARDVAELSKDSRLPFADREAAYVQHLTTADWRVKVCKLADMLDNILDSAYLSADGRKRTVKRLRGYLEAIRTGLPELARRPFAIVSEHLDELAAKG
jgi:guanosine-3',5'-bis(diphosphate) 3'-pyrophosphohydrolase